MRSLKASPYYCGELKDYVLVNPKTDCSSLSDESIVSFVPMTNVQEKNNIVSFDTIEYKKVKKGFTSFQKGDLIWAKITPCMQNGKSCVVDQMPTGFGFGSTEFHVIRSRNNSVYMPFIWAVLSSDDVLKAAQAVFSGSAGQQRVSSSFIEKFPALVSDYDTQVRLANILETALKTRNEKKRQANQLLLSLPEIVMNCLGISFDYSESNLSYATKGSEIINRIDADFYSPKFVHFRNQIENSQYPVASIGDIAKSISTGFAAGKQDQADELSDEDRVPHLRPFSITPEGELSFKTKKYVPKSRVKESDYCKKDEVIFNNTNSPDLVGKTTVFDSDILCTASNHMTRITVVDRVNPYYVSYFFNVLLNIGYWKLLCTNFNNQAGVNTETLKSVRIPLPDIDTQNAIVSKVMERRTKANQLRKEAEKEWQEARKQFEKELLEE